MLSYHCNHCKNIICYEVQDDIYGDSHIEWVCPKCLGQQINTPPKTKGKKQKPFDLPF